PWDGGLRRCRCATLRLGADGRNLVHPAADRMVRDGEALIRLRLRVVGCAERLCSLPLCHDGSTLRLVPAPPGRRLPSEVAPYREPGSAALCASFGTSAACLSALAVAGGAFLFGDAFPARC